MPVQELKARLKAAGVADTDVSRCLEKSELVSLLAQARSGQQGHGNGAGGPRPPSSAPPPPQSAGKGVVRGKNVKCTVCGFRPSSAKHDCEAEVARRALAATKDGPLIGPAPGVQGKGKHQRGSCEHAIGCKRAAVIGGLCRAHLVEMGHYGQQNPLCPSPPPPHTHTAPTPRSPAPFGNVCPTVELAWRQPARSHVLRGVHGLVFLGRAGKCKGTDCGNNARSKNPGLCGPKRCYTANPPPKPSAPKATAAELAAAALKRAADSLQRKEEAKAVAAKWRAKTEGAERSATVTTMATAMAKWRGDNGVPSKKSRGKKKARQKVVKQAAPPSAHTCHLWHFMRAVSEYEDNVAIIIEAMVHASMRPGEDFLAKHKLGMLETAWGFKPSPAAGDSHGELFSQVLRWNTNLEKLHLQEQSNGLSKKVWTEIAGAVAIKLESSANLTTLDAEARLADQDTCKIFNALAGSSLTALALGHTTTRTVNALARALPTSSVSSLNLKNMYSTHFDGESVSESAWICLVEALPASSVATLALQHWLHTDCHDTRRIAESVWLKFAEVVPKSKITTLDFGTHVHGGTFPEEAWLKVKLWDALAASQLTSLSIPRCWKADGNDTGYGLRMTTGMSEATADALAGLIATSEMSDLDLSGNFDLVPCNPGTHEWGDPSVGEVFRPASPAECEGSTRPWVKILEALTTNMATLDVSHCWLRGARQHMWDLVADTLAKAMRRSCITTLKLCKNHGLSAAAWIHVVEALPGSRVVALEMSSIGVVKKGMTHAAWARLAEVLPVSNITHLNLSSSGTQQKQHYRNGISEECWAKIFKALPASKIAVLDVSHSHGIAEQAWETLAGVLPDAKRLARLNAHNCEVPKAAMQAMKFAWLHTTGSSGSGSVFHEGLFFNTAHQRKGGCPGLSSKASKAALGHATSKAKEPHPNSTSLHGGVSIVASYYYDGFSHKLLRVEDRPANEAKAKKAAEAKAKAAAKAEIAAAAAEAARIRDRPAKEAREKAAMEANAKAKLAAANAEAARAASYAAAPKVDVPCWNNNKCGKSTKLTQDEVDDGALQDRSESYDASAPSPGVFLACLECGAVICPSCQDECYFGEHYDDAHGGAKDGQPTYCTPCVKALESAWKEDQAAFHSEYGDGPYSEEED